MFGNKILTKLYLSNKNIYMYNSSWKQIDNKLAIQILNSYIEMQSILETLDQHNKLKSLNFQSGKLNDDFCIYFANNI